MPVIIEWDDEQHQNIAWTFSGSWSWAELLRVIIGQSFPMIASVAHPVHHIADVSDTGLPGLTLSNMRRIASHIRANPRADGMVVFIGASALLRGLALVFIRLYPHFSNETHFVDSRDEARRLIARRRTELAEKP